MINIFNLCCLKWWLWSLHLVSLWLRWCSISKIFFLYFNSLQFVIIVAHTHLHIHTLRRLPPLVNANNLCGGVHADSRACSVAGLGALMSSRDVIVGRVTLAYLFPVRSRCTWLNRHSYGLQAGAGGTYKKWNERTGNNYLSRWSRHALIIGEMIDEARCRVNEIR